MSAIPPRLQARFEGPLEKRSIPNNLHGAYKKWLRHCHLTSRAWSGLGQSGKKSLQPGSSETSVFNSPFFHFARKCGTPL